VIYANGGGAGLVEALFNVAEKKGIVVRYGTRAIKL
jgi:phytoene dehydrogenase-like protein